MADNKWMNFLEKVVENLPSDWLKLTTHRLDIYHEEKAKVEFLDSFEALYKGNDANSSSLSQLPTAYDYIRLGHPLSSVLEWTLSKMHHLPSENVISFSSRTMPLMAVLRKNLFDHKKTLILHHGELPNEFDLDTVKEVYGYHFEIQQINDLNAIPQFDGSIVFISSENEIGKMNFPSEIDFFMSIYDPLGSIILVNGKENESYISAIQHVRRRESIAMTPANCYTALQSLLNKKNSSDFKADAAVSKAEVIEVIKEITGTRVEAVIGSSGLSIQYAIMMGLVDDAFENHPGKDIKIIVPPNCYGGTNDQARRLAACYNNLEVMDLAVDGDNDMVESSDQVLEQVAKMDAVPFIIAEIPTNPRVEVPDLEALKNALGKERLTKDGNPAVSPVFILDQTFCPNVQFLSNNGILAHIKSISYVSGSKFPSGGKCTAGYCVSNEKAEDLMSKIEKHIKLCDNEATPLQLELLAEQMPSMLQRIKRAYENTFDFVHFIKESLPAAKINFVSEDLAEQGFTPSVFSLDLPTKGETHAEREAYKRELNLKLIDRMINEIPNESKYCVSYGQLKGCYWTIPATSTQGTTKESDKDYIARVAVSPDLDLNKHKRVFKEFVEAEFSN